MCILWEGDQARRGSRCDHHGCKPFTWYYCSHDDVECSSIQFFCVPGLEAVRKFSRKPVKVLAWMSGQAAYILHPYAPVSRGGRGDFRPRIMEEVAKTGRPIEEVSEEVKSDNPTMNHHSNSSVDYA